ncbi:MAG: hypothetical protein ACTSRA_07935, partial [Promethearchaeota archaeon]
MQKSKTIHEGIITIKLNKINLFTIIAGLFCCLPAIVNVYLLAKPSTGFELELNFRRNVIEFLLPIPAYILVGVLPAVLGIITILFSLSLFTPSKIVASTKDITFIENYLLFRREKSLKIKDILSIEINQRRSRFLRWIFIVATLYWGSYIWKTAFESFMNRSGLGYFSIYQGAWGLNVNYGFTLFLTCVSLFVAAFIMAVFPRKQVVISGKYESIQMRFFSLKVKEPKMMLQEDKVLDDGSNWVLRSIQTFIKIKSKREDNRLQVLKARVK